MKLRDQEKILRAQFEVELYGFKANQEKHRAQKYKLRVEIAKLQKQMFWVKMRAITAVVIKYKNAENIGVADPKMSTKNT